VLNSKYFSKINLIYFQVAWYFTALFAQLNQSIFSLPLAIGGWFVTIYFTRASRRQVITSLCLAALGMVFELVLIKFGLVSFPINDAYQFFGLPLWLISIWLLFSSVLPTYIQIFQKSKPLGALVMAFFAPLSYIVAMKMGIMTFEVIPTAIIYGAFWFCYFLLSTKLIYL
jgi:Protein of unknown function (DUF2878)